MKIWTAMIRIEMPDETLDKHDIRSMISDTLGDEVYNRYGEGNAYATDVLAGEGNLLANAQAVNEIHALLDFAIFRQEMVRQIADIIEQRTGREVHAHNTT